MPDELTHRLWWKLGDYLSGEISLTTLSVWRCETQWLSLVDERFLRALLGPPTPAGLPVDWVTRRRQRLESLYSEMTWELMGAVA